MSLRVDVLTLFPEMFDGVFGSSILGKAHARGLVELGTLNFRAYATNKHNTVDDYPFGGGGGMVIQPEPIFAAVESLLEKQRSSRKPRIILMCPQGARFSQEKAEELAAEDHLIFICGHYEGIDERVREHLVTDELSIGDFVLTGGELAAMTMIDAVVRLLPDALGNSTSARSDSFCSGLLEHPQYTRPAEFRGWKVPDVLLSGHHANIEKWRRTQSIERTWKRRPELLDGVELSKKEKIFLEQLKLEGK